MLVEEGDQRIQNPPVAVAAPVVLYVWRTPREGSQTGRLEMSSPPRVRSTNVILCRRLVPGMADSAGHAISEVTEPALNNKGTTQCSLAS